MEKKPSARALAFQAWMKAMGTNTRQVHLKSKVAYTTLASFVQGDTQSLRGDSEAKICAAYGASADEIFGGPASDQVRPAVRLVGRVGSVPGGLVQALSSDEEGVVPPLAGATVDAVAVQVAGPLIGADGEIGAVLYFGPAEQEPPAAFIGATCLVETEDGRTLIAKLRRGEEPGRYDLELVGGGLDPNVKIASAARLLTTVWAAFAKDLIVWSKRNAA